MPPLPNKPPVQKKTVLVFGRRNYLLMIVGVLLIAVGLFVMTLDGEPYGFGALGLTVGPMIVLAGFLLEFWAIMLRAKPRP